MLACASLVLAFVVQRTPNPPSYAIHGASGKHRFIVKFRQTKFQARGRTVIWMKEPSSPTLLIPAFKVAGKTYRFYGWDGYSKEELKGETALARLKKFDTELTAILIVVDGKPWPVARTLFWDLLEPDLTNDNVKASLSSDGAVLKVHMDGSDGAGGYGIDWTFRRNGKHTRKVELAD